MGLRGDYQNSAQNSALIPCKQCRCGVVLSKFLSDPVIFTLYEVLFHYLMNLFI